LSLTYELREDPADDKQKLRSVYRCDGCGLEVFCLPLTWWRLLDLHNQVTHYCCFDCIDKWVGKVRAGGQG
jgi:hypothetical protein